LAGFLLRYLSYREVFALVLLILQLRFALVSLVKFILANTDRRLNVNKRPLLRIGRFALPGALIGLVPALPYLIWAFTPTSASAQASKA